jgi:tetratricopeptide (TPR) repeat protein
MRQRRLPIAILLLSLATPAAALAQDCPTDIPASSRDRRALAKEWFGRAEAAESVSNPIAAAKAYQCSLRIVPHAFTAFNLGRLAEKTGDLELALEAFNTYLQLAPEAQDRKEIEGKISALSTRISALRNEQNPTITIPPMTGPVTDPVTSTPPTGGPVPDLRPTPSEPGNTVVDRAPEPAGPGLNLHPAVYVASGVVVASLVGGVVLNLSARSKMDECRSLVDQRMTEAADKACKAARPRAFTSYALFGVAAAAAAADAFLIWMSLQAPQTERLSLQIRGDGLSVGTRFSF